MRMLRSLPEGPRVDESVRESKLIGKLELPSSIRPAARPGIAFVGDAALAGDPFWGIGCGWAFQSAEWLADEAGPALAGGGDLDAALGRYRRTHFRRLAPHHLPMVDFSSGRPSNLIERTMWRAASRDPEVVRAVERVASRNSAPLSVLTPRTLARAVRANLSAPAP
jgi:2-polyprenyl-6-methoxyphenol hydroxylase-like FAD-dependent oxidoreductase